MASFQAKIDWKMPRKREYTIMASFPFRSYPTRNRKFQKNSKKIEKIKIYHYGIISRQNRLENAKKQKKIKIIGPFRSHTTRNRKFQ